MMSRQNWSLIVGLLAVAVLIAALVWEHRNHSYTSNEGGGVAAVKGQATQGSQSGQQSQMAGNSKNAIEFPTTGTASETNMSGRDSSSAGMQSGQPSFGTFTGTETHENSFTGCIVDRAGKLILEDADGRFYILDNSEQFPIRAGEEVILHGTTGNSASELTLPSGTGPHPAVLEINVTKINVVSATCKLPPSKHSGKDKHTGDGLLPN